MSFDHGHRDDHEHAAPSHGAAPGKRTRTAHHPRRRHPPAGNPGARHARPAIPDPLDFLAPPRKLRADITHREQLGDGDGEWKSRLVIFLGPDADALDGATLLLTYADGRPFPRGDLELIDAHAPTASVKSRYNLATLPIEGHVLVTIPPKAAPELHPDGSIGDDVGGGLEA